MKPALPWVIAAVVYVGLLLPLLLTPIPRLHTHQRAYLREFRDAPARVLARDLVLNVVVFVPLGWLLGQAVGRTPVAAIWAIGVASGVAALLSLTVETVQYFIPTRYSSILDVLANTAGAAVGAITALSRRRRPS
jgi:VanZ family protein